jgi:hypothetical protein
VQFAFCSRFFSVHARKRSEKLDEKNALAEKKRTETREKAAADTDNFFKKRTEEIEKRKKAAK